MYGCVCEVMALEDVKSCFYRGVRGMEGGYQVFHGVGSGEECALNVGCDLQGSVEPVALLASHLWWGVSSWGLAGFLR